jgi:ABC-type Zn2+ transport system substrate-binding protein/surface adhesin
MLICKGYYYLHQAVENFQHLYKPIQPNVITITPKIYNPVNQISRFDTTLTNTLACANTFAAPYKPIWITSGALHNSPSTGKFSVYSLNSSNLEEKVDKPLAQDNLVKIQS